MTCSKQFTFLLILLTYGFVVFSREDVSLKNQSERIKRWPNRLSIQVNNAFEDSVGLSRLQSLVDKASHRTNSGNGGELLVNISAVIDNKLQAALQALITNKELIESAHQLTNESINDNCCDSSYDMKYYDERFSRKVNTTFICALSPSSSSNSPVVPSLENVYKKNLIKSAAVKWQYFGSSSGSYHQYPASDDVCSKTETFDPRLRSWYVSATSSIRKRLIVIIDISGSMSSYNRMSLAKHAALAVLDTLRPDDHVTALAFSTTVSTPSSCYGRTLAKATASNLRVLKNWIRALRCHGGTMYSLAFKKAFKLFENSGSIENGKDIILFLTDGRPNDDRNKIYSSIQNGQHQMNNSVTIFTYGLGRGMHKVAKDILNQIALRNGGKFTYIPDGSPEKLKLAFGCYYKNFISTSGNLALGKPAFQSSLMSKHSASHAIDGRVDGECSRTTFENDPWWSVDLQREKYIMAVTVTNCCEGAMENVEIRISNSLKNDKISNKICGLIPELQDNQFVTLFCSSDAFGRYVNIKAPGNNRSLALCEVKVYETLVPSSTLSMPCTTENGTTFGVAAIDISLGEVFSEVLSFSYGQYSYGVVLDIRGRVWIHPRSPHPEESTFGPSMLPLQVYESWMNDHIIKKVLSDPEGHIRLEKVALQYARGYARTDGMQTKQANVTIHWKRIRNMFILLLVMDENDVNYWLMPGRIAKERLFEQPNKNFGVCQVNGTPVFIETSVVKSPLENRVGLTWRQNNELNVTSTAKRLNKIPEEVQAFHPGIEADLVFTDYLESNWKEIKNKEDSSVLWRYVGTQSGVYRQLPGVSLTANFNHKNHPWFKRALTKAGQFALSYPFDDPFGLGTVISISKAILKQRKINKTQTLNKKQPWLIAVLGMDMSLSSFRRMALNVMPGCLDEYDCFFMDQSGYLFLKLNEENAVVHLTEKFSWLGKIFVESLKILKPSWCNSFLDFKVHLSYETVKLRQTIVSNTTQICRQYVLLPLQNISASLLVVPSRRIQKHCQDQLPQNLQEGCDCSRSCRTCSNIIKQCQCPCTCPMSFDRCHNSILDVFTRISCPAPTTNRSELNAAVTTTDMNSVKYPKCEKSCNAATNKRECHKISRCIWCENTIIDSCETFCPFNISQRISLKFNNSLNLLIPNLNKQLKTEIEKRLQEKMYNVLEEKLENDIQDIAFNEHSVIFTIRGSLASDVYTKVRLIKKAIKSRNFFLNIPNNGRTEKIHPMGMDLFDVDECTAKLDDCHENAQCSDTEDSYNCTCRTGFYGNGEICLDINECENSPCHANATCTNVIGSFQCTCLEGFLGSGFNCSDFISDIFLKYGKVTGKHNTTEEPYSTEGVSTSESYANHFGTISIVLFITFSVVITSCCSLCIFILLLRRNHRKRKVNPEKICLEMPILTVNQSPSSILTEKNDLAGSGRTERSELNHRNRTIGIATQIALEWNEVDV